VQEDLVIVLADVNKDIKGTTTQKHLRKMGLVEVITFLHKETPPPTHQHGQSPIDGIFVSPVLLDGAQGEYLAFDEGLGSDHQGLWLNILASMLWGTVPHQQMWAKARQLQCKDPQVMKKYNDHLQPYLMTKKIPHQVQTLAMKITGAMSAKQEHDFKQIDKEITKGKIQAEKQSWSTRRDNPHTKN